MDVTGMELIGSGAEADVYRDGDRAIKVFKHARGTQSVRREADLQARAALAGLPVPAVHEVLELDGRPAIAMEYLTGDPLGAALGDAPDARALVLRLSVELQRRVHRVAATGFPGQKEWLAGNIADAPHLDPRQRSLLTRLLATLETGDRLCHGDFHVWNLVATPHGPRIVDWGCARAGHPAGDACRTYLLYLLYLLHDRDLAARYLEEYCRAARRTRQDVLAWLPVVPGARLNENVTAGDVSLLHTLIAAARR